LSIRDLAKHANVSPQTVMGIELGTRSPRPSTMVKLAAALGVDAQEIDEFARAIQEWKTPTPTDTEET